MPHNTGRLAVEIPLSPCRRRLAVRMGEALGIRVERHEDLTPYAEVSGKYANPRAPDYTLHGADGEMTSARSCSPKLHSLTHTTKRRRRG